jgi:phospholipid transport system substrate-binding protein
MTQVLTIHAFVSHRRDPRRRRAALVMMAGAALAVFLAWTQARADEPALDGAITLVNAALADTGKVFADPNQSRAEAAARLRELLDHYVDLPRVGQDSLGSHWRKATPEQQAAFVALFERFLANGYSGSVAKFGGLQFGTPAITERSERATGVRVDVTADGAVYPVLFSVGRSDDGSYRVTDVVAASISMSRLLSDDFGAYLRANGGRFDALLDALDKRVATTPAR